MRSRFTFLIMATLLIAPLAEAVQKLSRRTPVGSTLGSAEWAKMPLDMRERSQFSAGVEDVRVMQTIQQGLQDLIGQVRNENGVFTDRSKIIEMLGRVARDAGLTPSDPDLIGTIQDITSERRAELIVDTQTTMAYGHANWKAGQDRDALEAFPAQELLRIEDRKEPRDWRRRWVEAGGNIFEGERMVALKTDEVWAKISRFKTPWPPFDFGSGMGVEDVSREEAEQLGLLEAGTPVEPIEAEFNSQLEASVNDLQGPEVQRLQSIFGDQVTYDGRKVQWQGNLIQDLFEKAKADVSFAQELFLGKSTPAAVAVAEQAGIDLAGAELRLSADDVREALRRPRLAGPPLTGLDFAMVPQVWRAPDAALDLANVTKGFALRKEFGGNVHTVVWRTDDQGKLKVWSVRRASMKGGAA